jgi:hypothetical protein
MRGRGAATLAGAFVGDAFHIFMLQPVALEMIWVRVTFLLHNVAPSLVLARFRFLLDHVSVPVVPHVNFLLAHVLCCRWITYHFFIRLRVVLLLVHVSISYLTTRHDAVRKRVVFLYVHVA